MKGLYIDIIDTVQQKSLIGVKKKIAAQIKAFENLGVSMDHIDLNNNEIRVNDVPQGICVPNVNSETKKYNYFFKVILKDKIVDISKYDVIYIRRIYSCYWLYRLVKEISSLNIKVLIEVPTYPYKEQFEKNIKNKIFLMADDLWWKATGKYIDKVVVLNNVEKVNNVDAVGIINGIDIDSIKLRDKDIESDSINLIGLANISKWHGYDRLIKGMSEYYKDNNDRKVKFFVVGDGPEKANLESLTKELGLEDKVIFTGVKVDKELDDLFDEMHIGISSLALFRAGGGHDPIKAREYAARGIASVIGYDDRALPNELPFVFRVKEDESSIDVKELINEYEKLDYSAEDIQRYAKENLTWEKQIKKILDSIKN